MSLLPENKRRDLSKVTKKRIWIYGKSFVGKTTFANTFPDPLMLNTDGNHTRIDAPVIEVKDQIEVTGRLVNTKLAWQYLKEVLDELERNEHNFKTLVIDLLEDLYEFCRLYKYKELGISHESDNPFKSWDIIRGEYLKTIRRIVNLPIDNIVFISHEDATKDITSRGGDKVTQIKPNINDKIASKVAGMVDFVTRIIAYNDNDRKLTFKQSEEVFGGGRLGVTGREINLHFDELTKLYNEVNNNNISSNETTNNNISSNEEVQQRSRRVR